MSTQTDSNNTSASSPIASNSGNSNNETKQPKRTWLWHYRKDAGSEGFDPKQFSGRLAFERTETAKKAIHAIGTPYFSQEANLANTTSGFM